MINPNKWNVETSINENGDTVITIVRPANTAPRAAACVSRTKEGGTLAHCKVVTVDPETLETNVEEKIEQFDGKPEIADMEKQLKARGYAAGKVLDSEYHDGGVFGIPRDVFYQVAVAVERPESQK